jgi:hypothetical protein
MPRWKVEGLRGPDRAGFERVVVGSEKKVRLLLERLACRNLSDEEIADATFGSRTDLEVRWANGSRQKALATWGSDHNYVATLEATNPMPRGPKGEKRPPADVIGAPRP